MNEIFENDILRWILNIAVIMVIYRIVVSKKMKNEGYKHNPNYKIIFPILISLAISYLIILLIPNSFFEIRTFDPDSIISVIKAGLNNIIAIHLGLTCFMWRYIATLFKAYDIKNIRLWHTTLAGLSGYFLIILITILPYLRIFIYKIMDSIFGIN